MRVFSYSSEQGSFLTRILAVRNAELNCIILIISLIIIIINITVFVILITQLKFSSLISVLQSSLLWNDLSVYSFGHKYESFQ